MNKEITIYELINLIRDEEEPKKVKYENIIYTFDGEDYISADGEFLFETIIKSNSEKDFAEELVTILEEAKELEEINVTKVGCSRFINIR